MKTLGVVAGAGISDLAAIIYEYARPGDKIAF
jgi:hypothetical protein